MGAEKNSKEIKIESLIVCPICKDSVRFSEEEISCGRCGRSYPIIAGIPRLLSDNISNTTRQTFDRKWELYYDGPHPLWIQSIGGKHYEISYEYPVSEERYLTWKEFLCQMLKVDPNYFRDRIVLDAGCGVGWLSYTMVRLGATVAAADLADSSVTLTYKILRDLHNFKVIQTDLTKIPFRTGSIDTVVSLGVMHHTANTKETFLKLSDTVRPEGEFFLQLYEKVQPFRENLTEVVRKIIHLFPKETQLEICKRCLTVDFSLFKNRPLRRKLFRVLNLLIMLSNTPEGSFDTYSPKYNHRHTFDEVKSWYEEADFTDVRSLTQSPAVMNTKSGYGGALWMVGRKR